jgi:hypothetical protein
MNFQEAFSCGVLPAGPHLPPGGDPGQRPTGTIPQPGG